MSQPDVIRANGAEELYDHANDPHEWTNLADAPRFAAEKKRLAAFLRTEDAPEIDYVGRRDDNAWDDEVLEPEARSPKSLTP